jgi:hypothetical protein
MQTLINEITYLAQKLGFDGMAKRMADKHKLTAGKDRDTTLEGTAYGVRFKIVCGKHNNRSYKKVLHADGKTVLYSA